MASFLQADLNYGLIGGTATWLGEGTWTAAGQKAICIDFYNPDVSFYLCSAWFLSFIHIFRMTNQHAVASWSLQPWVRTNPLNSRTVIVKCEEEESITIWQWKVYWGIINTRELNTLTSPINLLLSSKKYSFQGIVDVNFIKVCQIRQFKSCSNTQGRVSCVKTLIW